MAFSTAPSTLETEAPKVLQVYPGFNAQQVRTILESLGIESPARLPNSYSTWVYEYPNIKALLLGCISVSVSQFDQLDGKPRYQIAVKRFATPVALTAEPFS